MTPFLDGALRWLYPAGVPKLCPACGFDWSIDAEDALIVIVSSPNRFEAALAGRDGMKSQADGSWNATAYLWHLTDLTRSWAERWVQISDMPGSQLVGWDPDELAEVRGYRSLPTSAGLWALRSAVEAFAEATATVTFDTSFEHGDWGEGNVADGLRWLGHEFHHHEKDVAARAE
jgi:hypothetical protein